MTRRATATLLLAVCLLFALAPAASAGLVGDVAGGVEDVLGGGDGTSEGSGSDGEPSGSTGDDPLGGTIGGVTDVLDGDEQEDPVKKIQDGLGKTVDETTNEIDEATSDPSGYVGGVTETVDKTVKDPKGTIKNKTERTRSSNSNTPPATQPRNGVYEEVRDSTFAAAREQDARSIKLISAQDSAGGVAVEASTPGIIAEIGRVAAEAAEQVAFPLALALMVGAFLMVQNRIDRRDPKLALAPIDADHEMLTFS